MPREAVRFLITFAVGSFGICWFHRTPGAGPAEIMSLVIIISAPIQLIYRLRGWQGFNAVLHQHDRLSTTSGATENSSNTTGNEV
jgi:hypothetical protein